MAFENRKSALNLRARVGDSERLARCPVSDKPVYQAESSELDDIAVDIHPLHKLSFARSAIRL
jgi:hypothetical protein